MTAINPEMREIRIDYEISLICEVIFWENSVSVTFSKLIRCFFGGIVGKVLKL